MNPVRLLILTLLVLIPAQTFAGTTRTVEWLTFTQPEGSSWEKPEGKNHVVIKFAKDGVFQCGILIVPIRARDPNLVKQFQKDWQGIEKWTGLQWERAASPRERTVGKDTPALEDAAVTTKGAMNAYSEMIEIDAGSNAILVFIWAPSAEVIATFKQPIDEMLASFVIARSEGKPAARSQKIDLRYQVPAGWMSKESGNIVQLERRATDRLSGAFQFGVFIMPSQPLQGSLRESFLPLWQSEVASRFQTPIAPLPMVRRLKSGLALAYDGGLARNKAGRPLSVVLYVLAQGSRIVPIVGVFFGGGPTPEKELNRDLLALMESAEILDAGTDKVALYSPSDLVGDWETSSASHASYVTSSGNYAGDASITTAQGIVLREDKTFHRAFFGMAGGGTTIQENDDGKWKIDDGYLLLQGEGTRRFEVLGFGSDPKVGAFLVLSSYSNIDEKQKDLGMPRRGGVGRWYKRKD